jgi:hypothetical protein
MRRQGLNVTPVHRRRGSYAAMLMTMVIAVTRFRRTLD